MILFDITFLREKHFPVSMLAVNKIKVFHWTMNAILKGTRSWRIVLSQTIKFTSTSLDAEINLKKYMALSSHGNGIPFWREYDLIN